MTVVYTTPYNGCVRLLRFLMLIGVGTGGGKGALNCPPPLSREEGGKK